MKIEKNDAVRSKYNVGMDRKGTKITEIVIHGTGGGSTIEKFIQWMMKGERAENYIKGESLFHYLIGLDGKVIEIIDPKNWVWHSSSGGHDRSTIGIEHINPDLVRYPMLMNRRPYPNDQMESSVDLITSLLKDYPIKTIVGHGQNQKKYSGSYRNCPGAYDWEKLIDELKIIGYTFKVGEEKIYDIDIT